MQFPLHSDGSTHVVLDPLTFLERRCALVPRPRRMLLTYHGVLAPAAGMRDRVVPPPTLPDDDDGGCDHDGQRERHHPQPSGSTHTADAPPDPKLDNDPLRRRREPSVSHAPAKNRRPRQRYSWAELLRRVYVIAVFTCPRSLGRRTLLAAIHDPDSIRAILQHLGLPIDPPNVAPTSRRRKLDCHGDRAPPRSGSRRAPATPNCRRRAAAARLADLR